MHVCVGKLRFSHFLSLGTYFRFLCVVRCNNEILFVVRCNNEMLFLLLFVEYQFIVHQSSVLQYKLDGEEIKLESCGVKASVIDFTLSRLSKGNLYSID